MNNISEIIRNINNNIKFDKIDAVVLSSSIGKLNDNNINICSCNNLCGTYLINRDKNICINCTQDKLNEIECECCDIYCYGDGCCHLYPTICHLCSKLTCHYLSNYYSDFSLCNECSTN